jgi:hypothetical protein
LPCTQERATGPYYQSDESRRHPSTLLLKILLNVILSYKPRSCKWYLPFMASHKFFSYMSLPQRALCLARFLLLHLIILTTASKLMNIELMRLLVMQLSPASHHLPAVRYKVIGSILFSNTLSPFLFPNVTHTDSHKLIYLCLTSPMERSPSSKTNRHRSQGFSCLLWNLKVYCRVRRSPPLVPSSARLLQIDAVIIPDWCSQFWIYAPLLRLRKEKFQNRTCYLLPCLLYAVSIFTESDISAFR